MPEADRDELRRLSDLLVHREPGVHDVPPAGIEAAITLVGYYTDMLDARRRQRDRRPHLGPARRRDRRRPPRRRGDHRLPVPDGRGRQRDHDEAAGQRLVLGLAQPGRAGQAVRRPVPHRRLGRGDAALRHVEPGAGPHRHRGRRDRGRHDPGRRTGPPARRVGQPRRRGVPRRRPLRPRPRHDRSSSSFGVGRHFCLGASLARLEARVCLDELVSAIGDYDIDAEAARPRALGERPGLRQPCRPPWSAARDRATDPISSGPSASSASARSARRSPATCWSGRAASWSAT